MKIIFAGGGTGGHVMPALAVAQALCDRQDVEIEFVGTKNGMEAQKAPQAGYRFHAVRASQVKGVGVVRGVKGLLTAIRGIPEARRLLRSLNPDVVSCVGGYAGFSAGFAASLVGTPLIVQEANAVPGRVNRFLARRADIAAIPFEETRQRIRCRRIEVTGNAVRPSLVKQFKMLRAQKTGDAFNLFVFGGSQGARRLNEAVMAYAESLGSQLGTAMTITHQTGSADYTRVSDFYRSRKMDVKVSSFIEDMATAYAEADLVLSRAGGSVAELTALGLPAILVPYPHAADDHQRANAEILRRAGAALMINDEELTGPSLAKAISDLRAAPEKIESMSRASRDMGQPDAANKIADLILSLGGGA